jgi:hypothetical protein
MRTKMIGLLLLAASLGLAACDIETKPADPNMMLPPSDRPPPGKGLFSGEDGVFTIDLD